MAKKISLREAKESNIRYTGLSEEEQRKRLGYAPAAGDGGEPQEQAGWRPDRQTAAGMMMTARQAATAATKGRAAFTDWMEGRMERLKKPLSEGRTIEGGVRYNPQTRKLEETHIDAYGGRTFSKLEADEASRRWRQEHPSVDMTVVGQMRRAQDRLQELKEKRLARAQELADENRKTFEGASGLFAGLGRAKAYEAANNYDQTLRALDAAIRQTEEQLKTLGEQQDRENGKDVGFWRGFSRVVTDPTTWDFGMTDLRDAATMLHAADPARPQTEQEKQANQDMLRATYENQQTEAMYGDNASFWNRAGMMTGHMPSFMLDFAFTGGGFEAINMAGKASTKLATKVLGKEAIEQMAELGFKNYVKRNGLRGLGNEAANWTIKALGTTADELLIRAPLMTNTVQGMDTAADIIDRKLGDVTIDENGNYNFTNDKTWGSAIWQGEANSIVENYSEMFGAHLPEVASVKNLGRLANVIGAKRLSGVLAKADAGALGGITDGTRRIFQQMGVSDYLGEVSEEYYGQLWRTMLNLDDAYRQNPDGTRTNLFATGQFHGDIWGGMALSMGLMGAGKTTMSAANYLSMKHDVNKADARASELLTPEVWEPLRSTIDMATNDNVGDVAEVIVNDRDMTDEEKTAVMNYMERSLYLRGVNLAELVKSRGGEQDENAQRANDSYMDGYNAVSQEEMQDASNMYMMKRGDLAALFGLESASETEEFVGDPLAFAERLLAEGDSRLGAVLDYVNARMVYEGMMQRVRDDIDSRVASAEALVDSRVNRTTGMIEGATLKVQTEDGNDRRVYVVGGKLSAYEDGTGIDKEKSDSSIIIRDAETGKVEMVSPDAILSIEEPVDPETEKQTAAEVIRQQMAQEAANRIDGAVPFNEGDTYRLTYPDGRQEELTVVENGGSTDAGEGRVWVTRDGGFSAFPMKREEIQAGVDATNRGRAERFDEQRQAQMETETDYGPGDVLTLRGNDGETFQGEVVDPDYNDGTVLVQVETPAGPRVMPYTREELGRMRVIPADGGNIGRRNIPQNGNIEPQNIPPLKDNFQKEGGISTENVATVSQEAVNNATVDDLMKTDGGYVEGYYNEHPEKVAEALVVPAQATADYINGKLTDRDYLIALGYANGNGSWLGTYASDEDIAREAAGNREKYLPYVSVPQAQQMSNIGAQNIPASADPLQAGVVGRSLSEEEAEALVSEMEAAAKPAPEKELTPQAWSETFDENNSIETPVGRVKMGDNQIAKFFAKGREKEFGMVGPTLSQPDVIIEKISPAPGAERDTKYLFIKSFLKPEGKRYIYFESVTVQKDGMEISVSSHEADRRVIKKEMQNGKILHLHKRLSPGSGRYLTETPSLGRPDLVPTSDNNGMMAPLFEGSGVSSGKVTENAGAVQTDGPVIPRDAKGRLLYELADPDMAWDAIVEQAGGNEAMAQRVADSMVSDKEAELKKAEKAKPKGGTTVEEKLAAERERENAVERAKANLAAWQRIAQTSQRRKQAALAEQSRQAEEAARLRREKEERERADREEAERIRREALNGVPDIIDDTPQDARARGYRRVNGEKVDRQAPLAARQGKEVLVKFDDKNIPTGHVALIEVGQLQPSHINGRRNPFHFIDEAQPKERNDDASVMSARRIAAGIRPEEITSSVTAYTGAPTVNTRGEVIQGNNRSAALREMWAGEPEQAAIYKQYLTEHASDFGLTPEDVESMQQPVLVNMVDVSDEEAISLGQFVAQDTESGGTERIKPKNIVKKMGGDMKTFAGRLLSSPDEEMTFSELVDRNGMDVLKWMQQKAYITPTQYRSAFDSKGNLSTEAKNDLKGIMYQSIFQGGSTHLEEMFNSLPAKAQKAILATAYRDYDSPNTERLNTEVQNSISAYYALSQTFDFANAKNYKEARMAAEAWKRQYALDDVTGESYLPSERYSNFALLLATMYKGQTQAFIQNTLKNIFDLVQGTKETTLFEEPDNTPRTLVEAVNETMNGLSDELLLNENFIYNGQRRNNVLAGGSAAGQQGRQGSTRDDPSGGRTEGGTGIAADNRGTEGGVGQEEVERREAELASRVQVNDDDWQEGNGESPTYKRSIIIDGTHTATQIDEPDENGHYTGSYFEFDNKRFGDIAEIVDYIDNGNTLASKIAQAEAETDQNPTEAQKEAGNYKKGHVRIGQFNITVENPKGSMRRGTDANGNPWETTMQNTYGYIRSTEGVDGDHIDVFLTNDIDGWNGRRVYVVDQYNEDGTFDEHKVMLGFNDEDDARNAYLSNYSEDWAKNRKIIMTSTNLEDFEKWINSSHRKTKPFAEYKSVNVDATKAVIPADRIAEIDAQMADLKKQADEAHRRSDLFEEARIISESNELFAERRRLMQEMQPSQAEVERNEQQQEQPGQTEGRYTVEQRYHKKNGTYIYAVNFTEQMPREQFLSLKKRVKDFGGYYSSYGKGGFIFDTEETGRTFAEAVLDPSGEKLDDNKPLSLADMQQSGEPVMRQVDVEGLMQAINQNGEAKLSDHFVVGRPGLTEEMRTGQEEETPQSKKNDDGYGADNKLVSRERYEELKKRMRRKLGGQLNMGIDPEILAIGTEMAAYHIEAGARKFADYARHMIDDLGDAIRPYLKSFYNGARDLPEVQEAGYADEMTPYDEVRTFDTANFDKAQGDALATAEMVMAEQEAQAAATAAKEQLTNQRNEQRRQEDEQRTADTEAVAGQAEAAASKAESDIEAATDEKQINGTVEEIDRQLDKVNEQLALLGYYEADQVEGDFNEAYGYMRNAEKKAVKDANSLANRLVKDLGIDPKTIVDKKGKRRRSIAKANIAPIGGDISIYLPLGDKRELYISIQLDKQDGDNLKITGGMLRIENPNPERGEERYLSSNNFFAEDETYLSLLRTAQQLVKHYASDFVPVSNAQLEAPTKTERKQGKRQRKQEEPKIADLFSAFEEENRTESQDNSPFQKGDAVVYQGKPATVYDIEDNGRLVLDTGLAPVLYESADPKEVQRASGKHVPSVDNKQAVSSQVKQDIQPTEQKQEDKLSGDSADYQKRAVDEKNFVGEVAGEISYIASQMQYGGEFTPLTMTRVKKMLDKYDTLHDLSTTDIQELIELAMTKLTRLAAQEPLTSPNTSFQRKGYENIVALYNAQPMLNARDSTRVERQQYSTPTPFGYVMGQFVRAGREVQSVLEPSAGNGALTIAFDPAIVHVNDIDDRRLSNLRTLGYGQVTGQNALLPFEGEQVDAMLTNPPFGSTTQKVYDDIFKISSLEGQMAINALDAMKDNGRAAIVIGGNTEYRENGVMKPKDMQFFGYLYSHYNVVDVINMDGEMYARNGTKYPVRIILIDGRKTGAFKRVIPPVKSKARAEQVKTFDELYNRIQDDILQLQQMGSETAGSNGEATATDRGTRKPDGSTNNRPNAGNGNEPLRTGERSRSTQSDGNTPRPERNGRTGGTSKQDATPRVDNGNRGNAGSTDNVPQQPSTANGEQPSGNVANEPRRSGGIERRDTASQSDADGGRLAVSLTDEKVPYPNRSQSATLMSVVPANQAQVLAASLADIGDVDQFLVDSLGYSSKKELFSYLAAEQIDSVALAINQMSKGNGFIIGDMTGVGKGRQGAALIRYAVRQGKKPIYFTQKPALFADNYRDLCDIGSSNLRPFIIASSKDGVITDAKGNVVYKLPTKKEVERVFDYIMQNGTLPDEYDYAITTYSQIQNGTKEYEAKGDEITETDKSYKGKTPAGDVSGQVRRDVIAALANDNYLILDESHTVGGQGGGAMFMQYIMPKISGVTFLSATFAKRPDNMPLYAMKTALSDSGMKPQEMIEAIAKGGVTLQEIMSKQLVQSGQMIRRERSFQGVNIDWLPVTEEADKVQRAQFDEVADIFNAIRSFQDDYIKPLVTQMSDDLAEQGSYSNLKRGTEAMGVKNTPFASKMYNLVNQLLFALKADAVADRTIWNLKHGFKPVISFTNTMEGFLEEAPKDTPMDEIPNFSLTLLRALDGVMRYQVTDADNKTTGNSFKLSELSPEGQARYNEIRSRIMNLSANLPISPMDTIKIKIEETGYTVGEITGRTTELIKDENGKYVIRNRTDKDKKAAARDFNNGKLDVLIINKSGSTGISLHSSPKFADQRQRVMVFAQFQQDISDEVQMRGRIDRTGQIYRGRYEYIVSSIPAEQRLQMMFKAKLKSLDANTTSSQKSKFNEMQVVDYLNKYGDEVTWQYMLEHPELSEKIGDPLKMLSEGNEEEPRNSRSADGNKPQDGCAAKIARYLPFLPVAEQESVFKDITEAYQVKIQLLNDAGENDLEITTMPLRAETKKRSLWRRGTAPNSGNAFADNTYLEEVEVDVLKKPMKANEVKAMALRLTDGKGFDQWRAEMHSKISQYYDQKATSLQEKLESKATERAEKQKEKYIKNARKARQDGKNTMTDDEIDQMAQEAAKTVIDKAREKASKQVAAIVKRKNDLEEVLDMFTPLQPLVIPLDLREDAIQTTFTPSYGTFVGYKFSKEYSPSTSTAIFATLDGRRKVELPLRSERVFRGIRMQSTMNSYSIRDINMDNWDSRVPTKSRRTAYIVTGNLLQALVDTEKDARTKGYLISYSTIDGDTRQGILMPERFQPNDLRNSVPISSRIHQIRSGEKVESEDGKVSVAANYGWRGGYTLRVPKSKQTGYKYFGDNELRKLIDKHEFETKGNSMVGNISDENLPKVLDRLSQLRVTVLQESNLTEVATNDNSNISINEEEANDLYRIVDDESEIERLNSEPTVKVYRAMSLVDGKLYPPMSKKIGTGSNRVSQAPSEFGQWEVSDERPELVEKEGTHKNHIYIVKDNGKGLWLAYNPYFHTSRNPLNDQFAEAYKRPNLVTVEVEVPESELTSGYQAEGAKDPVGETKWNAGPVNRQLSGDKKRKVILSRWMRPVRIVPDSEVAQRIAELIEGENVAIPDNTVTPSLLEELKKLGVKIVDGINKGRKKAAAMMRSGNGVLSDDDLSLANDPVSKLLGKSTRTAAQRRAFAERERQRMTQRVQELAEKLHLDNVDIVTDASTLQGRRAKAKGFYSRSTGRITIVIPNHASVYDVEQTLLHEAVAHYGLRELFGEHFDTFLDNVFQNADEDVRRRIVELAGRRGWDFRTATEEYLASLAENTNFENTDASWWQKIKELFLRMLHKIGFENFSGVTLSDNELRYILWRSYENLAEPGRYRSILGEAEDVAKQNELKVGNYTVTDNTTRNVAEGRDELYRDGDPEIHERTLARDRYEQRVKRGVYQTQEALQDSMLGLREAMEAILKGEGKKKVRIEEVDGFENAYLGENRLSSVNKAEADAFAHTLFKPLLDEVGKLAPTKEAREELTDYMMAKHGLERNRVMRQREKDKLIDASELSKDKPQPPTENDDDYDLKMDAYNKAVEDWNNQVEAELGDKFEAIDQRDFAGLTALTDTDNVADAEAEARIMVEDYERGHNTDTLWERTNAVSDATLSKLYESGMMSKATYDNIRSMYDYYIPLRGFDEKTGEEAYAYLNSKNSAFNAPIKTAKGRKSKADDPFAYLQSMAESAIVQGNRNKLVKQKFLNFVLNHPSDLASVSDIWLKYDEVAEEWQPVFPDNINADDTPAEVERKMQDFEDKMKELAKQAPDLYKHGKDTVNIPYRVVETRDLRQHQIVVKRGGRDYVITINGNPRAAQALNGQTNPDNDMSGAVGAILKAGERINRELSALYTTRNPDFVVSNFIRDMLYSNSMMWIKESPNYALRFHRNFAKVNPVRMKMLLAKYRKNELDMSNDTERMFHQFMMNGGETGYSNMRDIEKHKNDIRREIRKANGRLPIRKAWDFLAERLDEVNRGVENCARFAAFMTSREMGRTIDRSIYDAKEISVNFNKKGSGAKFMGATGQTKLGNASAFMSGLGRSGFVFWNAAIQGTANFGRQTKRHPAKALTGLAVMFLLGALVASLGYGDDDEDDKNSYWNLPEYVRRSNLLFRAGDQWISIPLPVEYKAVYGLGELMTSTLSGKEHFTDGELAGKIAGQVSQLLPLDFMEGGGGFKAFIPSSIKPFAEAYGYKKSWTGLPLYKDTPYNKDMPEWTKAYKSANKYLVDLSETLNEMSGGDQYTKGAVDFNPAQVEYVLNGYFGGIANTINRMTKMGETLIGQREYDPNSFLVLNRILKNGDERTEYKAINNEYFRLKEEHDKLRTRLRNYERDTDNGVFDYAEKIDFLYNSPEYARYEIFENYRPDIDDLYDMLKEANTYGDKEAVKDIEAQLNELKKMMISDMNKARK